MDTYALPASIKRSAITAFWQVNSPKSGILHRQGGYLYYGSISDLSTEKKKENKEICVSESDSIVIEPELLK